MAFSSQSNEPTQQASTLQPPTADDQAQLDQEVEQALSGISIEDLMAKSVASGPARPTMDPARPVRGGRPNARKPEAPAAPDDNVKVGVISGVREGNVFVDLGGKSQGVCPMDQFPTITAPDGQTRPDVTEGQQ